ncbi:putative ubiquitin related modifier 1 [Paratrimastix pyriformis]|uniref:Ubiquitin-related modifier 1 homolog n=1 Tax=Paratrimastix pyriformis TaxID=342808 RepID=A0ABQ8UNE8_9EUKA|nr:putative ubiquitin related modifier 1 [Paratrimastix pyriformis]
MVLVHLGVSGGLEPLFGCSDKDIQLPANATVRTAITWVRDNLLNGDTEHQFMIDNQIRPGILVLYNDADCELVGMDQALQDRDSLSFISTIHGG